MIYIYIKYLYNIYIYIICLHVQNGLLVPRQHIDIKISKVPLFSSAVLQHLVVPLLVSHMFLKIGERM